MKTVDGAIYGLDYVPKTMIKFKIEKKEKKYELNSRQTVIEITGVVIPLALLPAENLLPPSTPNLPSFKRYIMEKILSKLIIKINL